MKDPRERFIENDPRTLQLSSEPITPEESAKAKEIFEWIEQN